MRGLTSALVAVTTAVISAVLLGWLARGLSTPLAWLCLGLGGAFGTLAWLKSPPTQAASTGTGEKRRWNLGEWAVLIAFSLFAWFAFSQVLYLEDGDFCFQSPLNLGDLSLHLTFVHQFANGTPFWPANPIYASQPLHYPIGVDLFTSLLVLTGLPIAPTFVAFGFLGCLATGIALWRWGGAFALAGFLFSGGTAGFAFLASGVLKDYQNDMAWKSVPLALFITQRSLLYAIPVGVALSIAWRARFLEKKPVMPGWIEWLFYASMPLFHVHTFLFLSFVLGCWLLILPTRRAVLQLILCAFIPASLCVKLVTGFPGGGGESLIRWLPGWMQGSDNPFAFWFTNFGLWPVCVLTALGWFLWQATRQTEATREHETMQKSNASQHLAFLGPGIGAFLITCFVSFAPWEWDNTKLMIWSLLAVLPAVGFVLAKLPLPLRAAVMVCLFFSGFISLCGGLDPRKPGYTLVAKAELEAVQAGIAPLPKTATFAAFPTFNNPLLLAGGKAVCGYDGHLMSHGINYRQTKTDTESLLAGAPNWRELAQSLGADYLYWGRMEQEHYPHTPKPWKTTAKAVAENEWFTIYDLRSP